jgi:predicted nucleic-acid-binding protein
MTAIDTNIVVRFLTRDDSVQFEQSVRIFAMYEVFIPDTVILETAWVLRYAYEFTPEQVVEAFRKLFGLPNVHLRDSMTVALALQWHENGLDFADALHLAQSQHCQEMQTFDQQFVRRSERITSCPVRLPTSD